MKEYKYYDLQSDELVNNLYVSRIVVFGIL